MVSLLRANSEHPDFIELVRHLDAELKVRDGDDHAFYNQFNKIDLIRHALVAYLDQTPAGCGAIKLWDDRTMEVKRMYVVPENRGKGIAGAILQSLETWAAEHESTRSHPAVPEKRLYPNPQLRAVCRY